MVGPGDVITDGFGHVAAHEDGPRVAHLAAQRVRVIGGDFQMLGRDTVDQGNGAGQVRYGDDRAIGRPTFPRRARARQGFQVSFDGALDRVGEGRVIGDQDGLGGGVVFGLAQQIGGDPGRIVGPVGQHQNFRRTRDHVDADGSEHQALGRRHIGVTGADDLVDRADRLGAVGQGAHGLGAADTVNFIDPGDGRRRQDQGVEHAVRRRHDHDQPVHARDLGRDGVHQHGRRIGCGAAGHVEARRLDRLPAIAQAQARGIREVQVFGQLLFMERPDAPGRRGQGRQRFRSALTARGVHFFGRDRHGSGGQIETVEPLGIVQNSRIAARPHVGQDGRDDVVHIGFALALGAQKVLERVFETGISGIKPQGHRRPP